MKFNFLIYALILITLVVVFLRLSDFSPATISQITSNQGQATLSFQPTSTSVPPDHTINLVADTSDPLAFADLEFTFDRSKVRLVSAITPSDTNRFRMIRVSSMQDANSTGRAYLTLGINPNTIAPSGTVNLASFEISQVENSDFTSTNLSYDTSSSQLVSISGNPFTLTSNKAVITSSTSTSVPGDFDGDGHVNSADLDLLISNFGNPYTIFDFNLLVGSYGQ